MTKQTRRHQRKQRVAARRSGMFGRQPRVRAAACRCRAEQAMSIEGATNGRIWRRGMSLGMATAASDAPMTNDNRREPADKTNSGVAG